MKAALDNQTTFPKIPMRQAVRWVLRELDFDIPDVVVRVEHHRGQRVLGRFYGHCKFRHPRVWARNSLGLQLPDEAMHVLLALIPNRPIKGRVMRGGPPPFVTSDWLESVLCVTAHEATHLKQLLNRTKDRPRWSEVEAEWAEYRLLKRWRERKTPNV